MKKIISMLISLLVVTAMTCGLSISAYAAGTVTYSADSSKFIFEPGSSHSPTDLFTEYKGLMPGDSVRQDITVKNDSSYGVKVKLYVRSHGAHEDSVDFLSKLHLTVAKSENNEMAYMFDAAADQTGGMTDWVYLGTLYSGGEVNLILNLDIPIELGNEYQDAIGYIDWEFKAEELPIDPDDPKPPQTGDNSNLYFYAMLASVSGIALVILIPKRKKDTANG
ncbi:MAG: LPXTG cell wall anchor domain-containing protein [Paludibacteraceae bacterium]|nr:LPXTG cell wall anchor domain-containing protein [Paludibacteraceae bacterium]